MAAYGYGYSRLADQGFIGFLPELSQDAWGKIELPASITALELVTIALAALPARVWWKLRIHWAIRGLIAASGSGTEEAAEADADWDSVQRRLDLLLHLALESRIPHRIAAAKRLRAKLLAGAGTDQTTWSRQKEVDFGRSQVILAGQEPLRQDIQTLKLDEVMAEVARTTEVLAVVIGHGEDADGIQVSRSTRIRRAQAVCSAAFNAVHEDIDWTISRQAPGPERDFLQALRKPLVALLDRYPISGRPTDPDEIPGDPQSSDEAAAAPDRDSAPEQA